MVHSAVVLFPEEGIRTLTGEALAFSYRHSLLTDRDGAFVHSLSGTSDKTSNVGTLATAITEQPVPTTSQIIGNGTLNGYEKHTYTYTIQFKETSKDQNAAQGAKFGAKIQVALKDGKINGID